MANDLNLPTIADDQADQQWQTSNDGDAAIADALSDIYAGGTGIDFSGGNVTLTATQYRSAMILKPSAALAAARTLILPAVRRPFIFHNSDATYSVTLKSTDGASPETTQTLVVAAGQMAIAYTNGSSPGLKGSVLATGSMGSVPDGDYGDITVSSSGTVWTVDAWPYDIPLSFADTPTAGQLMGKLMMARDVDFAANFAGSSGHVGTNPGATFDIDVKDNGSSIGTISVSTGGTFTFTTSSGTAKTVVSGHRLEFYAPANSPAEATVADIAATLKGTA